MVPIESPVETASEVAPQVEGGESQPTLRVGLVDDHHLVRESLAVALTLRGGFEIAGEASSSAAATTLADQQPDVLMVDISLGDQDGVQLIRSLRERQPSVPILVLTMHRDAETVRQAILAGASGYIVKGAHVNELVSALHAVVRGERYVHSSVASVVVEDSIRWLRSGHQLTLREREILALVASGRTAPAMARTLGISTNTVRRHLSNLAQKLDRHGMAALARYAVEHGLDRGASG